MKTTQKGTLKDTNRYLVLLRTNSSMVPATVTSRTASKNSEAADGPSSLGANMDCGGGVAGAAGREGLVTASSKVVSVTRDGLGGGDVVVGLTTGVEGGSSNAAVSPSFCSRSTADGGAGVLGVVDAMVEYPPNGTSSSGSFST